MVSHSVLRLCYCHYHKNATKIKLREYIFIISNIFMITYSSKKINNSKKNENKDWNDTWRWIEGEFEVPVNDFKTKLAWELFKFWDS